MIGKSGTGASFRGLANYMEQEEKMEWRETEGLPGWDRNQDIRLMEDTASMSRAEKPVYHLSISYSPNDHPSKQMMLEDGRQVLDKMGLKDHQAVFVAHKDEDYKHLHMMVNRVHPEQGKAWNPWNDRDKYRPIFRDIEKDRGYQMVSERNWAKGKALTNGEYHQLQENDLDGMPLKAKAEFYELDNVFDQAKGWEELRGELSDIGMEIKRKGRGGVLVDSATGQTLKLSRIDSGKGRNQSLGRLEKRFGKRKEFEKLLAAQKELANYLPDQQVRRHFGRAAREHFGSGAIRNSTKKALRESLSKSRKIGKVITGFSRLASSSNPVSGIAKAGLKLAKKINRELNKEQDLGRGR